MDQGLALAWALLLGYAALVVSVVYKIPQGHSCHDITCRRYQKEHPIYKRPPTMPHDPDQRGGL